ncbi:MAG TPA: hypothetical protein VNO52_16825 [Methylomirabilota bacterium]|nr:hypothetical protein [Methylomirabilota bacterium]
MINPAELVNNLVAHLRDIPELVAEMEGDPERIRAYHYRYPSETSIALAIHTLPSPGILVAWRGSGPGTLGGGEVWKHRLSMYLRAGESLADNPPTAYYRLYRLILKGVPATLGGGQPLSHLRIHPSCDPMDTPEVLPQVDSEAIDYFEVPLSFTEFGDE